MNWKSDRESGDTGLGGAEGGGRGLGKLKTFESFKNPVYRVYYGSMAGQWAVGGMAIFLLVVSLSYLVFVRQVTRLE
jgi:hypothetical protein